MQRVWFSVHGAAWCSERPVRPTATPVRRKTCSQKAARTRNFVELGSVAHGVTRVPEKGG